MTFHPDSAPHETPKGYDHPLFAVLGGELVSLEGHFERGVMSVLAEAAKQRGIDITGQDIQLVKSPDELVVQ